MKFGSKKAIFGAIWGGRGLSGFDLVWESATPPTHICERSPKKKPFFYSFPYGTARFWNEDLKKTNMKKIMMPTKTIHISGIQAGKSPNDVKRAFQGAGLQVLLWHSLQYLSFTKSAMIDQSVCDQSDCPHRLWSALVLQ